MLRPTPGDPWGVPVFQICELLRDKRVFMQFNSAIFDVLSKKSQNWP